MVFIDGALLTLLITLWSIILGTGGGFLLTLGRTSKMWWLAVPSAVIIEVLLALPVLVLMIGIYYCGPVIGLKLSGMATAVLALALSLSAFVEEIFRAALSAIPRGQVEAARALGMSQVQASIKIVIPQALRIITPPLLGQYIGCLKLSSLASVIAVYELMHSAENLITSTYRPLEVYTALAVMYLILILPLSLITRRFEATQVWKLG